jgi:hypothetical protein
MPALLDVERLIHFLDHCVERWHSAPILHDERAQPLLLASLVHGYNFALWHEEDLARAEDVDEATIGRVKRRIDPLNQSRNNAIEALDEWVLAALRGAGVKPDDKVPLHSETAGAIVDRLSILTLRAYHMREETLRADAAETHRAKCREKLAVLLEQRGDLARALNSLLDDLIAGRKRFKVYRQLKMYNDPALNPVLYHAHSEEPA